MNFLKLIEEGREDDFKSKYSQKFSPEIVDKIINNISPKFLDWVGKEVDVINFWDNFPNLVNSLKKFEKISSNLPKTDINQYKGLNELMTSISEYENRARRDVKKVEGGNIVYDDGRFFIVNPLTHESSCYYGKGTKWCTAAETNSHFNKYNEDGKLFYILDRNKATNDPFYKIALLKKFNGEVIVYDAKDDSIKSLPAILGGEKYNEIIGSIDSYLQQEYSAQLKIWADKESAQKERERLVRLETQRREATMRRESEARREDNEWELGPDCPEVGLKAHALFKFLVESGDVEEMTNEDRNELQRINNLIEDLQAQYDSDEDVRTDLLDEISDLEDERDEFESRNDVYDLIPVGTHYDLTQFEVIDSPNVGGRTYAVGDTDEMESSSYEYVEQLIDDIGYRGFNNGFAKGYIDNDAVRSHAEDVFENDVRDNPDSYFEDSDRELSRQQEEKIRMLNDRIEQTKNIIDDLGSRIGLGQDDEKIEEKIEELEILIVEYEEEIEEINENPEGEFPEDLIDDKVSALVDDAVYDTDSYFDNYGIDWEDFIDKDEFIKGVIESDGYGNTLSTYDGNADEVYVQDQTFYVIRID
jgi:hypothetical protein